MFLIITTCLVNFYRRPFHSVLSILNCYQNWMLNVFKAWNVGEGRGVKSCGGGFYCVIIHNVMGAVDFTIFKQLCKYTVALISVGIILEWLLPFSMYNGSSYTCLLIINFHFLQDLSVHIYQYTLYVSFLVKKWRCSYDDNL